MTGRCNKPPLEPRPFFIERGSTVRVRQRASSFRLLSPCFRCLYWRQPARSTSTQRPPATNVRDYQPRASWPNLRARAPCLPPPLQRAQAAPCAPPAPTERPRPNAAAPDRPPTPARPHRRTHPRIRGRLKMRTLRGPPPTRTPHPLLNQRRGTRPEQPVATCRLDRAWPPLQRPLAAARATVATGA
jgi:hypothetical protein